MHRVFEELPNPPVLDDLTQVHHGHAVGGEPDRGDVVGDQEVGDLPFPLQLEQAVEDLGLDGDVERAGRFVQHDQPRVDDERPGQRETLASAAGELVRVLVEAIDRQPHGRQHLLHRLPDRRGGHPGRERRPRVTGGPTIVEILRPDRFSDDLPYPKSRVEGADRVLENDLHVAAPRAQLLAPEMGDVLSLEQDRPLGRFVQPGDEPAERGLPGARLADETERLPLPDRDRDPVDRMDGTSGGPPNRLADAPGQGKELLDAHDLEERGRSVGHGSPGTSSGK